MALTLDQLTAITKKFYLKRAVDNIFQADAFLNQLNSKSKMLLDGGTSVVLPLAFATTSSAGWYAGADTLQTTDNEQLTGADYSWRQVYGNIAIKRSDELKNSGDAAVLSLLKQKVMLAEMTVRDTISTGLFSAGTTTNSIIGLQSIVSTSNTVGGISQSSYSWWQAQVDSTTTALSLSAMQSLFNNCSVGSDQPDLLVSGRTVYNYYYNLLSPQQRFVDKDVARGGFTNLLYNGKVFIVDSHAPSSTLYMVNTKYLVLAVHRKENMRMTPFIEPWNQNVKLAKIYGMLAFGSNNNRMHGGLTAITS